jgi:hypothetical protein
MSTSGSMGATGVISLSDSTREYGSVEFTEAEMAEVESLLHAILSGTAVIVTALFLGAMSPRRVRWPNSEWTFPVSIGKALLPHRTGTVTFDAYE